MPGFIDGHTHMDMPFGGTVTADDWDTGTAAALAGGTTTIVDFSLQDVDGTLAGAVETWQGKAEARRASTTACTSRSRTSPTTSSAELPSLPGARRRDGEDLHGLQGHAALHRRRGPVRGDADRARVRPARARPRRERRRDRQAAGAGARARRHRRRAGTGCTRPEAVEAEATNRAIRLAEVAGCPLLVVHVSCAGRARGDRARARARPDRLRRDLPAVPRVLRRRPRAARLRGREVRAARRRCATRPTGRRCGTACRRQDLHIFGSDHCSFNFAGQKELGPRRLHADPQRRARASRSARRCCGRTACARAAITENLFVAVLATNQAKVHGMAGRKGVLAPGADADIVVWDPDLTITATQANRHGNVDYTPYEGMTFTGAPGRGLRARRRSPTATARCSPQPGSGPVRAPHVRAARARARRSADGGRRRRPRGRGPEGAAAADRRRGRRAARGLDGHVDHARATGSRGELDGDRRRHRRARRGRQHVGDRARASPSAS